MLCPVGMWRCLIVLALCWCCTLPLHSSDSFSDEYLLQTWQSEDGLPHQVINEVLQDNDGYIWLASDNGLVRFDGVRFKEFSSPLIGNEKGHNVRAIVQEDESTLLMAPDAGGLVRLRSGRFELHPASAELGQQRIATLFMETNTTALWIGYFAGNIVRWENGRTVSFGMEDGLKGGQWSSFAYDSSGALWLANGTYLGRYAAGKLVAATEPLGDRLCIASSRSGGLWIASNDALWRMEHGRIQRISDRPPWAGMPRVRTLFEDRNGVLWIGTSSRGLFCFKEGSFKNITTSHQAINGVWEDVEGNLWAATHGGGLNRLRPRMFRMHDAKSGLPDNISYSVCEDDQGRLWIGNCDGGLGLLRNGGYEMFTRRDDWPALRVFSVCADRDGGLWLGTRTGLYHTRDSRTAPVQMEAQLVKDVHVLFAGRDGDVWVGADPDVLGRFRNGAFESFEQESGFAGGNVRAVAEDRDGNIWVGTESGTVFRFDGNRFHVLDGLPGNPIRALFCDAAGVLWIGTAGGGLILRSGDEVARITSGQGLADNSIFQILMDGRGYMWFGSPRGVFRVAREELLQCARNSAERVHAVLLGRSEGIPSVSCIAAYQPSAWRSDRGQLWFATRQGLLEVDTPAEHVNQRPPPVLISECLIDDREVPLNGSLKVSPNRRKLEFRFSVLSYTAPEKVQIKYRLDGFDSDWVEGGTQRSATYPKLPPGQYRFRVIASNNDGIWNLSGAAVPFRVLPAWWQTIWAQAAALLGFAGLIAATVWYSSHRRLQRRLQKLEQQQALEKERARIARDLHDDLGANLTQIALLAEMSARESVPVERLRKSSSQLVLQARGLVQKLDGILWTVNPKNDSLDKLATYLCQFSEQLFRLTPISCRFDVSEQIPAYPLSPEVRHDLFLVVKEAMNNIVKHSGATEVWLRLAMKDGAFEVCIEDNGHGFSPGSAEASDRNGLKNMRSRMEDLGGRFEMESAPGKGATLRLWFPLTNATKLPARHD